MDDFGVRISALELWKSEEQNARAGRRKFLLDIVARPIGQFIVVALISVMLAGLALTLYRIQNETSTLLRALVEHDRGKVGATVEDYGVREGGQ